MKGLLFTYALTYGGSLVAVFNPFYGLLVYVCFAIIRPHSLWHWSVPDGNYSRIIGISLLVGWALNGFGNWSFGRARPIVWALLAFLFWNAASAMIAREPAVAWYVVIELTKIVLPFLVGVTMIRSFEQLKMLAWVIALSQGYVAFEANLSYVVHRVNWISKDFGGMDNNCNAIALVCGTGFAFFLGLSEQKLWRRGIAFFAAALMTHAIMLSNSRGGMLALLITGAVSFVLVPKRPIYYFYLAIAVAIGARMAGPSVIERFSTIFVDAEERDSSAQSRLDLWKTCLEVTQRNPILGIGPNHFPVYAEELGYTPGKSPHTVWLTASAELGLPGLGLLLAFYIIAILRLWHTSRLLVHDWPEMANFARMVIAAIIGFMIAAQFVSLVRLELPYYVVLVGAGVLILEPALAMSSDEPLAEFDVDDSPHFASSQQWAWPKP